MNDTHELTVAARQIDEVQRQLDALRRGVPPPYCDGLTNAPERLVLCRIGDEHFALPLHAVEEVLLACSTSPVPEAPEWVLGLLNVRGASVPVVDLLARSSGKPRELLLSDLIVVCRAETHRVGLVVQEVSGVREDRASSLHGAIRDVPHAPYLAGLLRVDGQPVMLISIEHLLSLLAVYE